MGSVPIDEFHSADHPIQSKIRLSQRRQHPPANEQPTYQRIQAPPVRSHNVQEYSPIRGHGEESGGVVESGVGETPTDRPHCHSRSASPRPYPHCKHCLAPILFQAINKLPCLNHNSILDSILPTSEQIHAHVTQSYASRLPM